MGQADNGSCYKAFDFRDAAAMAASLQLAPAAW
jgi:hypothetical protein